MIKYTSKKTESLLSRIEEIGITTEIDENAQYLYFTKYREEVLGASDFENPNNLLTEDEFISILRHG